MKVAHTQQHHFTDDAYRSIPPEHAAAAVPHRRALRIRPWQYYMPSTRQGPICFFINQEPGHTQINPKEGVETRATSMKNFPIRQLRTSKQD
eukprot:3203141-Amphidinium_carterae.2